MFYFYFFGKKPICLFYFLFLVKNLYVLIYMKRITFFHIFKVISKHYKWDIYVNVVHLYYL